MNLQTTLKRLREEAKMTDADIGAAIGTSQATVTRLRNGVHKSTSLTRGLAILRLADEKLEAEQETASGETASGPLPPAAEAGQ